MKVLSNTSMAPLREVLSSSEAGAAVPSSALPSSMWLRSYSSTYNSSNMGRAAEIAGITIKLF